MVIGCGSAAQDDKTPTTQTGVPAVAGDTPKSPSKEVKNPSSEVNSPTKAEVEPRKKVTVAPPTAAQIERWTPAPFERVQLLAIREWEKTSYTRCLAPIADGQHFLVAGSRVVLWSVTIEEPEHVFLDVTPADQERVILSLAVSPDGKWFAVGDSKGMARIWSLDDRKEIVAKKLGSNGIQCLAISPDAEEIAAISYDREVTTWSAAALERQNKFSVNTSGVERIEYAASKRLAVAGESTSLWNTEIGKIVQELSPGRYSFALGRSPDDTRFLFGSKESLRIWNIAESKQESEIIQGVSGSELLAFSPDGKFLATTNGRSIQLRNLAERRTVQVIDSFGWPIVGVNWLPKTNLLVVASDSGCTRIWGTASQGEPLGLKPLHAAVAMPPADSTAPATPAQSEQVIDLRTFPRLPGSKPTSVGQGDFHCEASVTASEANSFYRYFLEKDGWTAVETPSANPAATEYLKNGFMVSVTCYDAGDGKINVMVNHASNYDLRRTPKFDAAPTETVYEAANTVSYRTKSELVRIETALLRKLHAAGWTGYSRLNSSHGEQPDARDLEFLRNGTTLRVSIGKFPADPASYTIQYSLFSNNASVPIPADSGFAEFDGSTKPSLVATTKLTLDQAREFYDKELTSQGWLIRELGRSSKDDNSWLSYINGQSDLTIRLTKLPDGRTLVRVGDSVGSLWEASQKKEEPAGANAAVGLEAVDFPVLKVPHSMKFDAIEKTIEVTVEKSTLAAAAEQFTKALGMLDWKPEEGGIRDEDYTLLRFRKGKKEISLRARPKAGNAVVQFEGDGLAWTKELPIGKQVVSYETWLRQNKLPAGLEVLDRYEAEMRAINAPRAGQ